MHDLSTAFTLEINGQTLLVPIHAEEILIPVGHGYCGDTAHAPGLVARHGSLNVDHLGAKVSEILTANRPLEPHRRVQDAQTLQRTPAFWRSKHLPRRDHRLRLPKTAGSVVYKMHPHLTLGFQIRHALCRPSQRVLENASRILTRLRSGTSNLRGRARQVNRKPEALERRLPILPESIDDVAVHRGLIVFGWVVVALDNVCRETMFVELSLPMT